jgi:hypothetical protein
MLLTGTRAIAAVFLAHPEKSLLSETGVVYHPGLGVAAWTRVLARIGSPAFRGLGLFLRHYGSSCNKIPGQFIQRYKPGYLKRKRGEAIQSIVDAIVVAWSTAKF